MAGRIWPVGLEFATCALDESGLVKLSFNSGLSSWRKHCSENSFNQTGCFWTDTPQSKVFSLLTAVAFSLSLMCSVLVISADVVEAPMKKEIKKLKNGTSLTSSPLKLKQMLYSINIQQMKTKNNDYFVSPGSTAYPWVDFSI